YLVVVSAHLENSKAGGRWPFGTRRQDPVDVDAIRRQLTHRCAEIERQLQRCGLSAHRLANTELVRLLYACWCPELARLQRPSHSPAIRARSARAGSRPSSTSRSRSRSASTSTRSTLARWSRHSQTRWYCTTPLVSSRPAAGRSPIPSARLPTRTLRSSATPS